jgi:NADH:ubiquinone oxidoreductase subunit F (NADH-binding)
MYTLQEGSSVIKQLLSKLVAGKGSRKELETVQILAATIKGTTLCPMGRHFPFRLERWSENSAVNSIPDSVKLKISQKQDER